MVNSNSATHLASTDARRRYQGIIFDVGGTLLNVHRNPQLFAVESIAHLGIVTVEAYVTGVRQAMAEWRAAGGRPEHEDLAETWVSHNRRALELAGFHGDIAAAARIMEETFLSDGWHLYPDTEETLRTLAALGYRLGVVSNWPATLRSTLHAVGVDEHFSVIVASGDVGYAKPHPRIFEIAAEQLGAESGSLLYIGDDVEHDVAGATAAGMDVVLLDRDDRHVGHTPRISTLAGLRELLEDV